MSARHDKAVGRLIASVVMFGVFFLMLIIQLGGGSNVDGVFPEPLFIVAVIGLPPSAFLFIVSGVQTFLSRNDDSK